MESKIKILSDNRSAGHDYFLSDRFEAGLVLTGTEVKAAKDGKVQLKEAFGEVAGNEAWLVNAHIGQYSHGNIMNHEPVRAGSCCCIGRRSTNSWGKRARRG